MVKCKCSDCKNLKHNIDRRMYEYSCTVKYVNFVWFADSMMERNCAKFMKDDGENTDDM